MTARPDADEIPAVAIPCPVCGSYSGASLSRAPALLAVCDVLVVWVLAAVGKRLVRQRQSRSRYQELGARPWHIAHTLWTSDEQTIDRALNGAWDVIPAMLADHGPAGVTADAVSRMLDDYVRDLAITRTPHHLEELRYRFSTRLGLQVVADAPYDPSDRDE